MITMIEEDASLDNFNLDRLGNSRIVGYCLIGENRYPIVEIEHSLGTLTSSQKFLIEHEASNFLSLFEINGQNLAIVIAAKKPENASSNPARFLTKREGEIAILVARGNSNKQIAIQLNISEWTVSTHLRRVFIKLGVDSRAAMVYRCADLLHQF
jgi:DNA-binding CsgD family transcriptional regulator